MELVKCKGMVIFLVLVIVLSILGSINNNKCKKEIDNNETLVQNI